ncbi:MAG: hypothetical protein JWN27_1333 [Candidatus Eremiobacteraeota bacterium]|nr:hypothetical protein [Candidatus Eremiobacteraeota bacterium]
MLRHGHESLTNLFCLPPMRSACLRARWNAASPLLENETSPCLCPERSHPAFAAPPAPRRSPLSLHGDALRNERRISARRVRAHRRLLVSQRCCRERGAARATQRQPAARPGFDRPLRLSSARTARLSRLRQRGNGQTCGATPLWRAPATCRRSFAGDRRCRRRGLCDRSERVRARGDTLIVTGVGYAGASRSALRTASIELARSVADSGIATSCTRG